MQNDNTRNTIIFFVLAAIIWIGYNTFVLGPAEQRRRVEQQRSVAAAQAQVRAPGATQSQSAYVARDQALGRDTRVPIEGPWLRGSLNLRGARIDDLFLRNYRETLEPNSPNVELLRPEGSEFAFFADFGWQGQNVAGLPDRNTVWRLNSGARLTPTTPIVLTYDNGQGLLFTRTISVDQRYLFTISDAVGNRSAQPVALAPYATVQRIGAPEPLGHNGIIHEGAISLVGDHFSLLKYPDWRTEDQPQSNTGVGGWIGITDKYWAAVLIPDQRETIIGQFRSTPIGGSNRIFDANYTGAARTIAPGMQTVAVTRLFAGAKSLEVLESYRGQLGLHRFEDLVDWGRLWFLTQPLFRVLHFFAGLVGNLGLAILMLTLCVRTLFFPLANKSYESMTKMKALAPRQTEIRELYKDDPAKQQQETMALYKREGVNPLSGCLPILLQIPVFYALYTVLYVTIEMRQAPFFGWIRDLSARDPTTIWNLFGLIPTDPATWPLVGGLAGGALHLGLLPIVYGFTMYLTTTLNPPAPDPLQQRIFQLFPLIFTFVLAGSPAGLLIYWTFSNGITILQQYVIMRRFKVDNPIDRFFRRFQRKTVDV